MRPETAGRKRGSAGFTLLEVLIALLVLALALVAMVRTAAVEVRDFDDLRERTLAGWLAQEILAETRIASPLPNPGRSNGQRRFGGRDWRWELRVQGTAVPSIRRLDISISPAGASRDPVVQLSGFSGSDLAP
jgi:general secretion pathway protein I